MAVAVKTGESLKNIQEDIKAFGVELARLLFDTPLPDIEKQAWAELVPYMTVDELTRFRDMLVSHLERGVFDQTEDTILAMKAEDLRRQFAHAHNQTDVSKALDAIEREVTALTDGA